MDFRAAPDREYRELFANTEIGERWQIADSVFPFGGFSQFPDENQVLDAVGKRPKLRCQQNAGTVAGLAVFGESIRHCAHIMRYEDSARLGRNIQDSDVVHGIKRLRLEIRTRKTSEKTPNDCTIRVIVRLEFDFHGNGCG